MTLRVGRAACLPVRILASYGGTSLTEGSASLTRRASAKKRCCCAPVLGRTRTTPCSCVTDGLADGMKQRCSPSELHLTASTAALRRC